LEEARDAFEASGFRSPATHRVDEWLEDLPFEYDCTVPNSDPFEPQPGGCCSPWPFMLGSLVELPYTMPQDHTLLTLLRKRSPQVWLDQLDALTAAYGLGQCVTHPDPGYLGDLEKRAIYAEFLERAIEREEIWHALPRDVARWWRRRDSGAPGDDVSEGTIATADAGLGVEIRAPQLQDAGAGPVASG